jgi:hypothetical protein
MTNTYLPASINAAVEADAQFTKEVAARAQMVHSGETTLDSLLPRYQDAVRKLLAGNSGPNPKQFFAKQYSEQMQFYRHLKTQGHIFHRASQADHDFLFSTILGTVDAGLKPAIRLVLKEYSDAQGYAPEWAGKVAIKTQPKKMKKSLAKHAQHPVLQDLKDGSMLTQTHKSALCNATYSGLAEMLFSGSQNVRHQKQILAELAEVKARLAKGEAEAARANARLDIKDAGLDWREKARSILATGPGMSNRELARRVGMHEATVRKYRAAITPDVTP